MKESGSIHAVITAIVSVGLIAAVGVIFYQNIIAPKTATDTQATTQETKTDTKKEAVLKEYCAQKEKLCFNYPEDWLIKQHTSSDVTSADNFLIVSPDSQLSIQFMSGLGGTGSCCGPMAEGPVTIIASEKAKKLTLAKRTYGSERADGAYVSELITSDVEATFTNPSDPSTMKSSVKGYIPQVLLHDTKKLMTPQTFQGTEGSVGIDNLMMGTHAPMDAGGGATPGSFLFGTVTLGYDVKPKTYASSEEAKKQLNSENFVNAKNILLSARYQ